MFYLVDEKSQQITQKFRILIKFLNTNITNLSNVFLSQQIAQITQRLFLLNAKHCLTV